jgi:aspartyl-tRNA(Asn)/glutamyl-tRNA(Gln) amidotransferase subunit A
MGRSPDAASLQSDQHRTDDHGPAVSSLTHRGVFVERATNPDRMPTDMDTVDLCFTSAATLARLIATREISPVAVTEAVLARAEAVGPALNIFAHEMVEAARADAAAAEAAVTNGDKLGKLHGVPISIKDNVAIAGLPLANGSAAFLGSVPKADAAVVRRIREAGAIIIGKTNLPEYAHKVLTDSPAFGTTRNPWNLERTPGGSSGGASAALAAGVAPLAVGTDGGGSIRCPASCTGIVGLKATPGLIPRETVPDAFANFSFVGPMARTVADTMLLLSVMAGPIAGDPFSIGPGLGEMSSCETKIAGLRIGWVEQFGRYQTAPSVAALIQAALTSLEGQGAIVEPIHPPCFDDGFEYYVVLAATNHATRYGHLPAIWGDRMSASIRASVANGQRYSAVERQRAHAARTNLFRFVQSLFERFDVIATPTMLAPPKPLDAEGSIATAEYGEWAAPLYPFNLSGHPAISVPAGFTADDLPVGLQLVGPWFAERRLLSVAAVLEQIVGWTARRPPI